MVNIVSFTVRKRIYQEKGLAVEFDRRIDRRRSLLLTKTHGFLDGYGQFLL